MTQETDMFEMADRIAIQDARIAELTAEVAKYKVALVEISEMGTWDSGLKAGNIARNALKED
ncbi:MAG: hypothetical protein AAGC76_09680 [Luteibacter sp.]|uniref:hypothetical protein n=1 Tax=Luteibacter sp. TaxID=1886636 RepID=UPI00280687AF|nr:hypothetical protein [Luteibacter sp.]MDQ7996111.1 hypothetical protein [Luteibacter sp.]